MAFIDYYKIMGISRDTPQKDIKTAYKKRAKQFHPDLHPDDPKAKAKFQALNEAYDVLNDPDKRARYDQYGEHWKQAGGMGGFSNGGTGNDTGGFEGFDFSQFGGGGGFSSFFEQLFGGSRQRTARTGNGGFGSMRHTPDTTASVEIDMYTALLGGEIVVQSNDSKLKLKIKPGTQPGTKVRLKGKGSPSPDGTRSDLILEYKVKLPVNLTPRQQELLRQMQAEH